MHKIRVKSISLPLLLTILGISASTGISFVTAFSINIQLPLFLIGTLSTFLIFSLFLYSRATTLQSIKIALCSSLIFIADIYIAKLLIDSLKINGLAVNPDFSLVINPAIILLTFIFTIFTLLALIKVDKEQPQRKKEHVDQKQEKNEKIIQEEEKISIEPEEDSIQIPPMSMPEKEQHIEEFPVQASPDKLPDSHELMESSLLKEKLPTTPISESVNPETSNNESLFEEVIEYEQLTQNTSETKPSENIEYTEDIFESELGSLPDISFDKPEKKLENKDYQYIPEDIRLVENTSPKTAETGGIISSIGKLLINQRDIENIIEINSVIQQVGNDSNGTNIITRIIGEKINEKLQKIEAEYYQIRDLTLSNKAGFAISSVIKNPKKQHTIGALASGAFLTLQNYLTRLNIKTPQKIFFEAENTVNALFKVDNFIFYFTCDKDFLLTNYSSINDFIIKENLQIEDIEKLKNTEGVIDAAITTLEGDLICSTNIEECETIATISSAIFENLKVFIKNIQPEKLSKITIFSEEKILTIKKYENNIASFITQVDGPVKLTHNSKQIQLLIL